ncbi:hypothetical protein M2271_002572, partial [Streptomyces sp. LBL]|nr:hypothetical protein [Streptomyces sp. LBL]
RRRGGGGAAGGGGGGRPPPPPPPPPPPLVSHLRGTQENLPGYELTCAVTRLEKVVSRV